MQCSIKIGFFFGAGAEISYGMPSGGKFAIDIFKKPVDIHKKQLKEDLSKIDPSGAYARNWLPPDVKNKPVYAFGKSEFSSLLQSSIEYNSEDIYRKLSQLDDICFKIIDNNKIDVKIFYSRYHDVFKKEFGETTYVNTVILNKKLIGNTSESIFNSKFYSTLLDYIKENPTSCLKKYASAILQLFVCVIGQNIVKDLNQEIFEKNETELSIFDDISTIFSMDFSSLGTSILNIVIDNHIDNISDKSLKNFEIFLEEVFSLVLEEIFSTALDYRKLIDEHFRYLYTPKKQWAKFTKMIIFLRVVKEYISKIEEGVDYNADGYYGDLKKFSSNVILNAFGTSNYTNILRNILRNVSTSENCEVNFLNGNTKYFYNPYKNSVEEIKDSNIYVQNKQLIVPFMLTQSGLKPLTSIKMSEEYVYLYNKYKQSDCIVCIGFGFNSDDAHINGIFRQLIEDDKKILIYVTRSREIRDVKERLQSNIRLSSEAMHKVHILSVDDKRQKEGILWTDYVEKMIIEMKDK